jgi:serine/threonine protein kinase
MPAVKETETFQHYQVLRRQDGTLFELGRGAMGVTYKAFDTNLRCDVALKVINALHLDSETARARFLREARAAAGLRHRNVASVYHLGNDDQSFFYAMEWVDGLTVESMVKEQGSGLAVGDALQIALQVARALGAASRQGLVHRDIKPANIMVAREDDEDDQFVVKVIDFGLARSAVGGEGSANITIGGFVGTPQYASPEQLEEKDLDVRSDIYSLGVTLWYMIAGRPPFTGALGSVFIQQMTKEPPWEHLAGAPDSVRELLAHILKKDPDQRPQTAIELRREIEACMKGLPPELTRVSTLNLPRTSGMGSDTSTPSRTSATRPGPTVTEGARPVAARSSAAGPGTQLAGRYELAELAGEGTNGRVYRALDLAQGQTVAVKVFHAGVLALAAERRRLEETMEKLRHAPHPCLKEVYALGESGESQFLAEEWVNGFSMVDVLRSRGRLGVRETLQLLAQIAPAVDHARAHGLNRVELSLHQILANFTGAAAQSETPVDRTILGSSIEHWPGFSLKLDALGITREAGDSVTWTGDMTIMPDAPSLGRDTQTSIRGLVESGHLFSLGALVYELLSGAPPAVARQGDGRSARYVALPALNEAANSVLRQVLSPNPAYASGLEFFQALCKTSGVVLPATVFPQAPEVAEDSAADLTSSGESAETMIFDEPASAIGSRAADSEAASQAHERAMEARAAERRAAEEAIAAEEARVLAEQRAVEEARLASERRAAEEARLAEEQRAAEEARNAAERRAAEEAIAAEEARVLAEQRAVEEARLAAERRAAEEARLAEEQRAAEEARIAAEQRDAEEARIAAERARIAAEQRAAEQARLAEQRRIAEEARIAAERQAAEQARIAAEQRAAEQARLAEERAAEKARIAAEKRAADEAREAAKQRAAEEARIAAEQRAAEKQRALAEKERLAAEKRAAAEARKAEQQRLAVEAKALAKAEAAAVVMEAPVPRLQRASAEPARGLSKGVLVAGSAAVAVGGGVLALFFLRGPHAPPADPASSRPRTSVVQAADYSDKQTVLPPVAVIASTPPSTPSASEQNPPPSSPTPAPVEASSTPPAPETPAPVAVATPPPPVAATPAPVAQVSATPAPVANSASYEGNSSNHTAESSSTSSRASRKAAQEAARKRESAAARERTARAESTPPPEKHREPKTAAVKKEAPKPAAASSDAPPEERGAGIGFMR